MLSKSIDHPLRLALNNELHGRSGQPVTPPAVILHFVFTLENQDNDPLNDIKQLCKIASAKMPEDLSFHHSVALKGGHLRFERHGEFFRISVIAYSQGGKEPAGLLPEGWLKKLPGRRLVAIRTEVEKKAPAKNAPNKMKGRFEHADVAASSIGQGEAVIWTDFKIAGDGFTHIIVVTDDMSPDRIGRALRKIHEIETYRMMALLALPVARSLQPSLSDIEAQLNMMSADMLSAESSEDDAILLDRLMKLAKRVEDLGSQSNFRFSAARAYAALVQRRIEELAEERVHNHQRLGVFMERRFSPAMATCLAVENRLANLAARCERTSNLLRTRVDISLEKQNQALLTSMDQRAKHQLRLQETVEGLSVVAISYYAWSLLAKLMESVSEPIYGIEPSKQAAALIPVVVGFVWYAIKLAKRRVTRDK